MTRERVTGHTGEKLATSGRTERQPTFVDPRYTRALAQAVSSNATLHSRDAVMDTVFGSEPGERPRYASQTALRLLSTAIGELRRNRKKIRDQAEKSVLEAIDKITETNGGSKAAIYHLLWERLGMFPQGYYGLVLPDTPEEVVWASLVAEATPERAGISRTAAAPDVASGKVTAGRDAVIPDRESQNVSIDDVRASLRAQLYYTGAIPALTDGVHESVLRTRFQGELHGMSLNGRRVPKPDDRGHYNRIDVAIIFCLAEFKGKRLPRGLNLGQLAQQILDEGRKKQ